MINFFAESWDFTLANYQDVWHILVQIGIILMALFIGNTLRNIIPFLKKSFIPSALIGGLLLLIVDYICKLCGAGSAPGSVGFIDQRIMQVVTYHALGIGFIAMTLKSEKTKNKVGNVKVFENGALTGGTYMLQAFVGLLITILMFVFTKDSNNPIFYSSGLLLPLSYGQGPGNALTWDINFTNILVEGEKVFTANGSFGLTLASLGFIVASLFGVVYINIFKKKGLIKVREYNESNARSVDEFESANEIPDSESIDKFSVQLGFVCLGYALSFGFMALLGSLSEFTNNIAWGFNFIWGVIFATLIKLVLNQLNKKKVVKRKYINNYQMDRISGFAFDLMIVAGVAAIEIKDVERYILPLIILAVVGALITTIYVRTVTKHCFKGYEHEMFVTNFGTLTGTASNGMILLKEIDPNFVTPASNLFVLSQFPAMIMVAPLLLLLSFASKSFTNAIIAMAIFFVLFMAYTIFLFRRKIFKKKYKDLEEVEWVEK